MTTNLKTPYAFQVPAIESIKEQNTLVLDECGLGKTMDCVEAGRYMSGPKLVICPKSIKHQWAGEIQTQDPSTPIYMLGVAGREPEDFDWDYVQAGSDIWVITHYDTLLYIGATLANHHWKLIVLDEAHRIKNRKAKRTLWAKQLKADRKVALSGTLMERNIGDLWSPINWLYPKEYEFKSYWRFLNKYAVIEVHPFFGYKKVVGSQNLDELVEHIGAWTFRRTKQDVAPDLPPKIEQDVILPLQNNQKKLYDDIAQAKDIEVDLREIAKEVNAPKEVDYLLIKNTLAHIIKLQQVTSDPHNIGFDIEGIKTQWVKDFVTDNPDTPMVVFTRFRKAAIRLARELDAALLVGGTKRPTVDIAPWLTGKKLVLVGTIDAMGEGLDLPRASVSVFLDQVWSSSKMTQAIDRIHRLGITEPKYILYLSIEGTVDKLIIDAIRRKWSEQDLVYHYIQAYTGAGI